jgi:cell division protein FtsB
MPALPRRAVLSQDLVGTIASARRWTAVIPSWVVLAMILLATVSVCATVIMRTRSELEASLAQHQHMAAEITTLRQVNTALKTEVNHLQNDPATIESAARARLDMVRPNEIVVALETRSSASKIGSFVR